jgi:bacteriocin-like protein
MAFFGVDQWQTPKVRGSKSTPDEEALSSIAKEISETDLEKVSGGGSREGTWNPEK